MNTNAIQSRKSSLRSRRPFRPEVLGLEERMMMASGPAVVAAPLTPSPVTAIDAANLPLSVKRVPGFLAGWKVDNLATPYDSVSNTGRVIDDKAVDYWKITLNRGDAVALSLTTPGSAPPPKGFVFRIWGPDNKEILAANKQPVTGTKFTYVAAGVGTYTIGISTSANAAYPFKPEAKQPAPRGPSLHAYSYTAEFNAYPGPGTNLVGILKEYKQDWPKWTSDQQAAYNTLVTIASKNNNQGTGIRNFSGSFEQVGEATPADIADWLKYSWAPFESILQSNNESATATNIYEHPADNDVLRAAYPTLARWLAVATPFITNQKLQDAYADVHLLLLSANKSRTDIDTFLHNLNGWSAAYQTIVGGRPLAIAGFLTTGLTKVPEMPKPVQQWGWLKTLIGSATSIISGLVGVLTENPGAALATSVLLNAIVNPLDAYLDGDFTHGDKPIDPAKTDTSRSIIDAASQMQNFSNDTFIQTFKLLASPGFESSLFSNYGLLRAMAYVRFDTNALGAPAATKGSRNPGLTPTEGQLRKDYDTTVWEQLLPRMFRWESVPYTDNGPINTLRNFTFFIPLHEVATWQDAYITQSKYGNIVYSYDRDLKSEWSLPGGKQQLTDEAKGELLQLQGGQQFAFGGRDLTPAGNFGPGPISVPQPLTGNSASFYTITPDSHMEGTLFRKASFAYGYWHTYFYGKYGYLDGATIHEWSLTTSDGERMGQVAADQLFGTGSLDLAGQAPLPDPDPRSPSYTYNFKVQSGGIATRFEVFSQWGQGVTARGARVDAVPGFSPGTFRPAVSEGVLAIDRNPSSRYKVNGPARNVYWMFTNMYADYKVTYAANHSTGQTAPPHRAVPWSWFEALFTTH